ncbi:meiotic rna-binding protein 1 [Lichtheimia corymbifera JMRC:FSU:9682]|uniref:Meiotic rna-binding protein 1 n=1 Tax=Lichtheimia corymbifera JMRC:FSU:9682 TaxID=1263082 RepID=A0A068SAK7_9FUNG|nr:meiotic rna-binding protein 1 [Lichtheimia corymbifera JMRC:FSU:9682]
MYESEKECQHAIDGLNKAGLQASFARVGQESFSSRLRSLQDETSTNIYISNLPLDMTEQKLEDLFQPHKTISNRILRDPQSGISRGVGFARLADRHSALTIIEKFNGHAIDGSSAPLQVRFADSPAQKRLKSQTARKRILRPREFQPMASFPVRSMMPVTPETMLGIAPASAAAGVATTAAPQPAYTYYPHDPHHPQYIHYPATLMTTPMPMHAATATAASPHTAPQQQPQPQPQDTTALASPPPTTDDKELKELTAAVEQKLDLTKQ